MVEADSAEEKLRKLEEHHLVYHHRFEVVRTLILAILTIVVSALLISYVFKI